MPLKIRSHPLRLGRAVDEKRCATKAECRKRSVSLFPPLKFEVASRSDLVLVIWRLIELLIICANLTILNLLCRSPSERNSNIILKFSLPSKVHLAMITTAKVMRWREGVLLDGSSVRLGSSETCVCVA